MKLQEAKLSAICVTSASYECFIALSTVLLIVMQHAISPLVTCNIVEYCTPLYSHSHREYIRCTISIVNCMIESAIWGLIARVTGTGKA